MAGYCLKNGRIQEAWGEDAAGRELAAVFHLTADGEMKELHEFPALSEGEGALAYAGEFYIEPLEVQIEFLKAAMRKNGWRRWSCGMSTGCGRYRRNSLS